MAKIDRAVAQERLKGLAGWRLSGDGLRLYKEWRMKDFSAAVELIDRIKDAAEALDHHPDLHLTGYRTLAVELMTHDAGGLSEKDFALAETIERLPKSLEKSLSTR